MPKYIACNAMPQSLLDLQAPLQELLTRHMSIVQDSDIKADLAVCHAVQEAFAEIHEALDGLVQLPSDLTGLPSVKDNPVVSIQVQTTKLTGAGVEVVSYKGTDATHWSLYLRTADGLAEWVEDIPLGDQKASNYYTQAMVHAAALSITYSAFIEQPK